MIISHKYKFVFIHIHKCAGTSITKALLPHLDKNDLVLGCTPELEKLSREYEKKGLINKHSSAAEVYKFLGKEKWKEYFTFSFVRNPYDLILSKYTWWHVTPANWNQTSKAEKREIMEMPFESFVNDKIKWEHVKYDKMLCLKRPINHIPEKTVKYFGLNKKDWYIEKIRSKISVDFVGKYESLKSDFNIISKKIGLEGVELPWSNYSQKMRDGNKTGHFYNEKTKSVVYDEFMTDFKLFNYY